MRQPLNTAVLILFAFFVAGSGPARLVAQDAALPFEYDYTAEAALADALDIDNPDPDRWPRPGARRRVRDARAVPRRAADWGSANTPCAVRRSTSRLLKYSGPPSLRGQGAKTQP